VAAYVSFESISVVSCCILLCCIYKDILSGKFNCSTDSFPRVWCDKAAGAAAAAAAV